MARKYTKVEQLAETVEKRHQQGETYGEIAISLGLEKKQVKKLMERQRRKERMIKAGYIPLRVLRGEPQWILRMEKTARQGSQGSVAD